MSNMENGPSIWHGMDHTHTHIHVLCVCNSKLLKLILQIQLHAHPRCREANAGVGPLHTSYVYANAAAKSSSGQYWFAGRVILAVRGSAGVVAITVPQMSSALETCGVLASEVIRGRCRCCWGLLLLPRINMDASARVLRI